MRNQSLDRVRGIVERNMRDYGIIPLDLGAACAFIALSQAVTLGNKVNAGELEADSVPTRAPGELMAMLTDDSDVRAMFQQIGGALYSVASVGNRTLTFEQTKGVFNINLGASEVVEKNPRLKGALDEIGYHVADGKSVQKVALATSWYWMFHRYHCAAEKLACEDAVLSHFSNQVPESVYDCLRTLLGDKELAALIL